MGARLLQTSTWNYNNNAIMIIPHSVLFVSIAFLLEMVGGWDRWGVVDL